MAAGCGRQNPVASSGDTFRCCEYCRTKWQFRSSADRGNGPERRCKQCERRYKDTRKNCHDCRTYEIARSREFRANIQKLYDALLEKLLLQNDVHPTKVKRILSRLRDARRTSKVADILAEVLAYTRRSQSDKSHSLSGVELTQISDTEERANGERANDIAEIQELRYREAVSSKSNGKKRARSVQRGMDEQDELRMDENYYRIHFQDSELDSPINQAESSSSALARDANRESGGTPYGAPGWNCISPCSAEVARAWDR
ncbi:hypothetical protein HWV62_35941 [Athelia sp. TMB]|nr:hypothetical protein HWV62_35941 [Athelia sp. TMB]